MNEYINILSNEFVIFCTHIYVGNYPQTNDMRTTMQGYRAPLSLSLPARTYAKRQTNKWKPSAPWQA